MADSKGESFFYRDYLAAEAMIHYLQTVVDLRMDKILWLMTDCDRRGRCGYAIELTFREFMRRGIHNYMEMSAGEKEN